MSPCAAALSLSSFMRSYFKLVFMMQKKGETSAHFPEVVLAPLPEFDPVRPVNHSAVGGLLRASAKSR